MVEISSTGGTDRDHGFTAADKKRDCILTCQKNGRFFKLIKASTKASVFQDIIDDTYAHASRMLSNRRAIGRLDIVYCKSVH